MTDRNPDKKSALADGATGFFSNLVSSILRDLMKLVIIFALGTLGGAVICFYYGFPLVFSFVGGIAIFAIAVAAFISS
jgi:hypothetical protein